MKLSSYQNLRLPNFSVHGLCAVLKDADLDWETALTNAEIDPDAIDRPGGTIPAKKELAFQLQFVALTKDRVDLWVKAAQAYTLGSFGIRGLALATAPTIAAWVEAGSYRLCPRPDGNSASPDVGWHGDRDGVHLPRYPCRPHPVQRLPRFLRYCPNFHLDVRQPLPLHPGRIPSRRSLP